MSVKKAMYLVLGFIGLGLGAVGAAVPLLPAFPFLMMAAFGFAKGSDRLNQWFLGTKLYQENLKSFVKGEGMTRQAKRRIITVVTLTMLVGFMMMHRVPVCRIILAFVWLGHLLYFIFGIKTIEMQSEAAQAKTKS